LHKIYRIRFSVAEAKAKKKVSGYDWK